MPRGGDRSGASAARLAAVWLGAAVWIVAAGLVYGELDDRWRQWSPGDFSLELCVVQQYGPLPDEEPEAEARRRERACTDQLRREHREGQQGLVMAAIGLTVLLYVGAAAKLTWRSFRAPGSH